jgi:hypothetical protein
VRQESRQLALIESLLALLASEQQALDPRRKTIT